MPLNSSGQERRMDPNNRMGMDFHAARAVDRFIPQSGRTPENIETAEFREGKLMQDKVRALLSRFQGKLSPEDLEVREFVKELIETQYEARLGLLNKGKNPLYDAKNPGDNVLAPTLEEATQTLFEAIDTLSPEEFKGFFKSLYYPVITLEPLVAFNIYIKMLDGYKIRPDQKDIRVSDYLKKRWEKADKEANLGDKIRGWNVALEEEVAGIAFAPELVNKPLGEKITLWKSIQPKGVEIINHRRHAIKQMALTLITAPASAQWSILNDETGNFLRVPYGIRSDVCAIEFSDFSPGSGLSSSKFHPSLVGRCKKP